MSIPQEHRDDAHKLIADGIVYLYELTFTDNSQLHLKNDEDAVWQGKEWEGFALNLTGVDQASDPESRNRPKLTIYNPEGIFSSFIAKGVTDNALVTRYRVLREHLDADRPVYSKQSWRIRRVVSLNKRMATFELRDQLDGQFFLTPARMFTPPEFPLVSLR